jgi:uncharacterized protein (DUF433 family)
VGLYSIQETAALASFVTGRRIRSQSISRWLWGQRYRFAGRVFTSEPLWTPQLPLLGSERALSFRDLIEVLFVATFRAQGVSLQTIRRIISKAEDLIAGKYPLSTIRFKTDGSRIIADTIDEFERRFVYDLDTGQYLLEVVFDRLLEGLDYSGIYASRWWPLGKKRRVVVDPERSFGRSIVSKEGVPTAALAGAFLAEESAEAVAYWYGVEPESVRDAVEYERRLEQAA